MRVTISMPHEERVPSMRGLRALYYLFLVAGILATAYAVYTAMYGYWFQKIETSRFEAVSAPAKSPALKPVPVANGGVIGELEVPRIGLKAIVLQGDSENELRRAIGHLPETAMPGDTGNVALAGHRDGLFRPLRKVLPGDSIILRTPDHEFEYQVEWTAVVPPTAVRVLQPTSEPARTLVTCYPFYYVGSAPERFVVRARKVPPELATPAAQ
jgi:sortase A